MKTKVLVAGVALLIIGIAGWFRISVVGVHAQNPGPVFQVNTAPSGACGGNTAQLVGPGGLIYTCQNGTWAQASGSGGTTGPTGPTGNAGTVPLPVNTASLTMSAGDQVNYPAFDCASGGASCRYIFLATPPTANFNDRPQNCSVSVDMTIDVTTNSPSVYGGGGNQVVAHRASTSVPCTSVSIHTDAMGVFYIDGNGVTGATGATGVAGATGATGVAGASGTTGATGTAGSAGAINPACTFVATNTGCTTPGASINVASLNIPTANSTSILLQCFTQVTGTSTALAATYTVTTGSGIVQTVAPLFSAAAAGGYCAVNASGSAGAAGATGPTGSAGGGVFSSTWSSQGATCNTSHIMCWLTDGSGINSQTDDGSTFRYSCFGFPCVPPGLISGFTTVNFTGATLTQAGPGMTLSSAANSGIQLAENAFPAGSGAGQASGVWKLTMLFTSEQALGNSEVSLCTTNGVVVGTSLARCNIIGLQALSTCPSTNGCIPQYFVRFYNPISTIGSETIGPFNAVMKACGPMYGLKTERLNSANNILTYSYGCGSTAADISWEVYGTEDFGSQPTNWGPAIDGRGTAALLHVYHLLKE